jgi:hypothetical protein
LPLTQTVKSLYEKFPYPRVSLLARVRQADSFLANYEANVSAAFGSAEFAVTRPRILVVGAGTFEPYVVALANPTAEIVAVDFSSTTLQKLKWRLRMRGLEKRVKLLPLDLLKLDESHGEFNMIFATGVLHHLPDPALGLKVLAKRMAPFAVLRTMLYSKFGRQNIYRIRSLANALGITSGSELKLFIKKLPSDHPLRIQFALYDDAKHEGGIQDGFFVSEDHPFDAFACEAWLAREDLVATKFLHSPSGQLQAANDLLAKLKLSKTSVKAWDKIGVLDRLSELESNYFFLSVRGQELNFAKEVEPPSFLRGNPVLRKNCPNQLSARLLQKNIPVGPKMRQLLEQGMVESEANKFFGTQNVADWESALVLLRERKTK